ncbi:MAG TPA: MiaB/RimO family radical SAM methylthiotransferase, partial [bacterium]|nr:MiaB/RimO family radical SAM methylthiotransferase [bacterium]
MRTAHVKTFGCKVNQHETTLMEDALLGQGYLLVSEREPADLVVVNSCTVTHRADSDVRKAVRQALRRNPGTFVVVTGCFAQVSPAEVARQEGIDLVLGNAEKLQLADHLPADIQKRAVPEVQVGDIAQVRELALPVAPQSGDRSRAFLKVQEGCHLRCAFCIVPIARGNERSVPLEQVLAAVGQYHSRGYPEIVLTGVHLGGYGRDHGYALADLVHAIDDQGLVRQRISSLEPMEVDAAFLGAVRGSRRVCRHFHLPLQAGSGAILRRMGRPYTVVQFDAICAALKDWAPETCIGTDIIVGFPGETEADFQATAEYLAEGPIDYAHLFPYSPREG